VYNLVIHSGKAFEHNGCGEKVSEGRLSATQDGLREREKPKIAAKFVLIGHDYRWEQEANTLEGP